MAQTRAVSTPPGTTPIDRHISQTRLMGLSYIYIYAAPEVDPPGRFSAFDLAHVWSVWVWQSQTGRVWGDESATAGEPVRCRAGRSAC